MAFWKFWDNDTVASIYTSILFSLSTRYNSRRVEDSSYASWNAILFRLCRNYPHMFLVCPQYGLYVSPNDPTNADTSIDSIVTKADGAARGVQVDNSVILPTLELRETSIASTVQGYINSILSRLPWATERELRVRRALVPILVEQKAPPPRHSSLARYSRHLWMVLGKARRQADGQAQCLLSMPKFGHQRMVISIVAAGGWWCFRIRGRGERPNAIFDLNEYLSKSVMSARAEFSDDEEAEEDDDDDEGEDDDDEFVTTKEAEILAAANEAAAKDVDRACEGPFSLEEINGYWQGREGQSFTQSDSAAVPHRDTWSKPMRLGTRVSDRHLRWIEHHLGYLAEEEILSRS